MRKKMEKNCYCHKKCLISRLETVIKGIPIISGDEAELKLIPVKLSNLTVV